MLFSPELHFQKVLPMRLSYHRFHGRERERLKVKSFDYFLNYTPLTLLPLLIKTWRKICLTQITVDCFSLALSVVPHDFTRVTHRHEYSAAENKACSVFENILSICMVFLVKTIIAKSSFMQIFFARFLVGHFMSPVTVRFIPLEFKMTTAK